MLTCPICKNEFKKIDTQHLKKHGLSKEEYFKIHGDNAPFGYSTELIEKKSGVNHPKFGIKVSEDTRAKISESIKNMWETGNVTEKQRSAIGKFSASVKGDNHFNKGKTFTMSSEQKELISKQLLKYWEQTERTYSDEQLNKWNSSTKYKIATTRKNNTISKYISNLEHWAKVKSIDNDNVTCICLKCNSEISVETQTIRKHQFANTLCHTCFPIFRGSSIAEEEIVQFLLSINPSLTIRRHDKTILNSLEIDIFIPELNLAIEFDGLYWHSDLAGYNHAKHIIKTDECAKQNIQLIHIFENEWVNQKEIVKSRLKNLLKLSKKIYARKCIIKEILNADAKKFLDENHIQSGVNCNYSVGLFFKDELVSVMTFSKPRFNKKYEWELIRFASKLNINVIGGASKLFNFFENQKKPKSIISYADRRWSNGNVYAKLNFTLESVSSPAYHYFKKSLILENRIKFQKHNLSALLESFDPSQTEWENMKNAGYNRIWDCGNLVFVKTY